MRAWGGGGEGKIRTGPQGDADPGPRGWLAGGEAGTEGGPGRRSALSSQPRGLSTALSRAESRDLVPACEVRAQPLPPGARPSGVTPSLPPPAVEGVQPAGPDALCSHSASVGAGMYSFSRLSNSRRLLAPKADVSVLSARGARPARLTVDPAQPLQDTRSPLSGLRTLRLPPQPARWSLLSLY